MASKEAARQQNGEDGGRGSALAGTKDVVETGSKEWARECYKGMENALSPSFLPDFKGLDRGRHSIRRPNEYPPRLFFLHVRTRRRHS